ncbi:odorant receptor 277 [Tribolium castaneum]|uniref:Odorant receptor n=1 Tax=Tribolium castaneum TaxID=7070 RepID=D2A343_TRICA|nr:odorant receptor 277 [Tribolium castaneum]
MDQVLEKFPENDWLRGVKFISSDIFQRKLVKAVLFMVLLVHLTASVITIRAILIKDITAKEFTFYGPVFFGCFYGMLAIYIILFEKNFIANLSGELKMWSFRSAGAEITRQIRFESRVVTIYAIINFVMVVIASCLHITPLESDYETFYMIRFFEDKIPDYANVCKTSYRSTFLVMGYVMMVHVYQIIYATQHGKFQIMLYLEYVKRVTQFNEKIGEKCLFYNESFQKMVARKLKNCVIRHNEFLKYHRKNTREMSHWIVAFSLCGCLLGISVFFYILSGVIYREQYFRVAVLLTTAASTFVAFIVAGQSLESRVDNGYSVVSRIEWYNFSETNKKTYFLLLVMLMQPWKIKFSDKYSINYELGLSIVRGIYSIISVMVNIRFDS